MSVKFINNISSMKINGSYIKQGKINGHVVFEMTGKVNINITYSDTDFTIMSDKTGVYDLCFANTNSVLDDYESIQQFSLTANEPQTYSYLNNLNVAPTNATRIVAVDKSGDIVSQMNIPSAMKLNLGDKLYSVGVLSDIHLDGNGDGNNEDSGSSQADFINAIQFFNRNAVDLICIDGDVTYYGYTEDYEAYKSIVNTYSNGTPIMAVRGNHECYVDGGDFYEDYDYTNTRFLVYINELYYEYIHSKGDIYLFCGMYKESKSSPFSDEEMTWLANKLEEYKNRRVFLFVHYYYSQVGNVNNISSHGQITNETFINLLKTYKNIVYFSGHTHLAFYLQQYGDTANIAERGDLCSIVHVPSCAKPRVSDDGEEESYYTYYEGSEGYLMDVYEDGILLKGVNFETNKYKPIATYYLDTTIPTITDEEINAVKNMNATLDGDLSITYDDSVLDIEFEIENNDLIVDNNVTGLDFNINKDGELEADY